MATGVFFANGRLAVVGRQTGKMFIYDVAADKPKLLASFHNGLTGPENTFLNDVTFAPDGSAFVTDSVNPVLYRMVPDGANKYRLEEYVHWNVQQLGWACAGAPGINFNGVVVTPDGKYLIFSKRNDSSLYRFEIATKEIIKVQLPDGAVFTQDGLFIDGRTVYAAQNSPQSVAILDFAPDYASATKRGEITHPSFPHISGQNTRPTNRRERSVRHEGGQRRFLERHHRSSHFGQQSYPHLRIRHRVDLGDAEWLNTSPTSSELAPCSR